MKTKTIWKYPIEANGNFDLELPFNSKVLCVQTQFNEPYLWAEVYPENTTVKRTFEVFETGHNIPYGERMYIGSFQLEGGGLVFHVYEKF